MVENKNNKINGQYINIITSVQYNYIIGDHQALITWQNDVLGVHRLYNHDLGPDRILIK